MTKYITILGIESSCDDTSAAIIKDGILLSNVIANQDVHKFYGGVVPELASRSHQSNILPVVAKAINDSGIKKNEIDAVAFTRGPGLLGSLLVGTSFAKGFAISKQIPIIDVNHLQGHILSHFIAENKKKKDLPKFPHLCLLISGGHTQIVKVNSYFDMKIIGSTIDDAAGETFDKAAKILDLPYPGGPHIDSLSKSGNINSFKFSKPKIKNLDFSFSGLKTSFLYLIRDEMIKNKNFITEQKNNLCASIQNTIIEILIDKVLKAVKQTGINQITLSGGVSANSELRKQFSDFANTHNLKIFIPPLKFTTDNAAMIAIAGYFKYKKKIFSSHELAPEARMEL